jgi:hypothetical protein
VACYHLSVSRRTARSSFCFAFSNPLSPDARTPVQLSILVRLTGIILPLSWARGSGASSAMMQAAQRSSAVSIARIRTSLQEALLPLVERVTARVEGGFESLDRVAVTVGPGSYWARGSGASSAMMQAAQRSSAVSIARIRTSLQAPPSFA